MTIRKTYQLLLLILLFILPFQSRWIYDPAYLNGFFWEYGSSSWYGTEILLWLIVILFTTDLFLNRNNPGHLFGRLHFFAHKRNFYFASFFILFLLFEVAVSTNFFLSYNYLFRVIEALCLFAAIIACGVPRKKLTIAFWAGAVLQSILGAFQFFSQEVTANKWLGLAAQAPAIPGSSVIESETERWLRAYGSFGSPNIFGGFLAVALIFGLLLYLESRPFEKIFYTLGQVIILVGLILSFSRGAWLAAAVGILTIGIVIGIDSKRLKFADLHSFSLFIKQMIFYFALVVTSVILLQPVFAVRMNADARLEVRSLSERKSQIKEALTLLKENPVFGSGPGTYTYMLIQKNSTLPAYAYQPVHNSLLLQTVEWGIFGILVLASFFFMLFKSSNLKIALPVLAAVFMAAFFDHYWVSLYSGQILLSTVIGLAFNNSRLTK